MPESAVTSDFEHQGDGLGYGRYSRLGEWYLTACFIFLLIEGIFYRYISELTSARAYWFTRLTPYNLYPSVLYFYGIGFLIGLLIILAGRRWWHVPIKGLGAYLVLWFVYVSWGLYGGLRHNPWWHQDIRSTILPSIVIPWVVVLAQNIRYDVVLSRIIKIAIPFAIWNFISGILFFAGGAYIKGRSIFTITWVGEYILLLAYVLAFARSIGEGKGAKLPLIILAVGILSPLHKPVLVTFLIANIVLMYLAMRNGLKVGSVRVGKTILVLFLLLIVVAGFGKYIFSLGEGSAERFLRYRFLKEGSTLGYSGGRIDMWRECLGWWTESPVTGKGLGKKLHGTREGLPYALPIHNLPIQTLMQTGVVGLIIAMVAAISWLWRSITTLPLETLPVRVWTRLALVTYVCAMLITTLYGETLSVRPLAFTFWIVLAMETAAHSQLIHYFSPQQSDYVQADDAYSLAD